MTDSLGEEQLYSYGVSRESWSTLHPRTIDLGESVITATVAERVRTITLDTYCTAAGLETVDFLKIDVEGAERRVLVGAQRLLEERRFHAVMIEVSDNTLEAFGDSAYELMLALDDYGFRTYSVQYDQLLTVSDRRREPRTFECRRGVGLTLRSRDGGGSDPSRAGA